MRAVITETQGSVAVEMRAWALRLAIEMVLDAGLEPRVWTLKLRLQSPVTRWYDTGCEPQTLRLAIVRMLRRGLWARRLAIAETQTLSSASWLLQWCWDASLEPRVWPLHKMILISHAFEVWILYLTTYLQWFLDSLQAPKWNFWQFFIHKRVAKLR